MLQDLNDLALLLEQVGDVPRAVSIYRAAIDVIPSDQTEHKFQMLNNLGAVLSRARYPLGEQIGAFEKAVRGCALGR